MIDENGVFVRTRVTAKEGGRVMVKQAMRNETDINVIVARWRQTGIAPGSGRQPLYGDFSSGDDFFEAMSKVKEAEASFMRLPAKIRTYCENDPAEFLELVMDPDRIQECEELGIVPSQLPEKAVLVRMEADEKAASEKSAGGSSSDSSGAQ